MAKELEDAINTSRRVPNMVPSAHVHNYQRIGAYNASFDVFSYTSLPLHLADGERVVLLPPDGTHVPADIGHTGEHPPARSAAAQRRTQARDAHAARPAQRVHGGHHPGG